MIFADGSVFPCAFAVDAYEKGKSDIKKNLVDYVRLGRIELNKTSFSEVFNGELSTRLRKLSLDSKLSSIPRCDECSEGLCVAPSMRELSKVLCRAIFSGRDRTTPLG